MQATLNIEGKLKLTKGKVLVRDLAFGFVRMGSIIIPDDDGSERGIHSRWAQVYEVADDVHDLEKDDYILIKHARWTRGMDLMINGEKITLWMIDYPDGVLLKSKQRPDIMNNIHKQFD